MKTDYSAAQGLTCQKRIDITLQTYYGQVQIDPLNMKVFICRFFKSQIKTFISKGTKYVLHLNCYQK